MTSYCNLTADNSTVHKLVTQHLFIKVFFFPILLDGIFMLHTDASNI